MKYLPGEKKIRRPRKYNQEKYHHNEKYKKIIKQFRNKQHTFSPPPLPEPKNIIAEILYLKRLGEDEKLKKNHYIISQKIYHNIQEKYKSAMNLYKGKRMYNDPKLTYSNILEIY